MVLTFDTFKLKLFDLIDFIGWNIKGYTTSGCKDKGIETSEFVTIELNSKLVCCFIQCYLRRMRLYSVVFDFDHNKREIFNLFLIPMVFFFQSQPKPMFFLTIVPVWSLYWSDVCLSPTFVPVQHLYQSDVCTSLTFVPVRHLYQSNVCTSPRFVLSTICIVQHLWVNIVWFSQ